MTRNMTAREALKALVEAYEDRHCRNDEYRGPADHVEDDTLHLAQHFGHEDGQPTLSQLRAALADDGEVAITGTIIESGRLISDEGFSEAQFNASRNEIRPLIGQRVKVVVIREASDGE